MFPRRAIIETNPLFPLVTSIQTGSMALQEWGGGGGGGGGDWNTHITRGINKTGTNPTC